MCIVLGKGCQPVSRQPRHSIFLLALTSSNPLSLTIHPLVPAFPIRLLWNPCCCITIPNLLRLIGFLIAPSRYTTFIMYGHKKSTRLLTKSSAKLVHFFQMGNTFRSLCCILLLFAVFCAILRDPHLRSFPEILV